MSTGSLIPDPETHALIGCAIEVHTVLGCGFLEQVYKDALVLEFRDRGVPFEREVTLPIRYKGRSLPSFYRVDFVCFEKLLVEVKALYQLTAIDHAQMINYLKAARADRGLVFNFGGRSLEWKRLAFSEALHSTGDASTPNREHGRWRSSPAGSRTFEEPLERRHRERQQER